MLTSLAFAFAASQAQAATVFDPAHDFNASQNPTGVWSYGWQATLGAEFHLFTHTGNSGGVDGWDGQSLSNVYHNPTDVMQHPAGTIDIEPGELGMHPGYDGTLAVVRFTAPGSGDYKLNAGFYGISALNKQTSTDVHVLKNGAALFDGLVEGHWANEHVRVGMNAPVTLHLNAGDHLDFAVGFGRDQTYWADSTRLDAQITAVPEAESWAMLAAGLGLLGFAARRKARA